MNMASCCGLSQQQQQQQPVVPMVPPYPLQPVPVVQQEKQCNCADLLQQVCS